MNTKMPELKAVVKINVIEVQEGQNSGIGPAGLDEALKIDGLEVLSHQA